MVIGMDTKKINLIPAEQAFITDAVLSRIPGSVKERVSLFDGLLSKTAELLHCTWIKFSGRDVWFNTLVSGIFPNLDTFEPSRQNVFFPFAENRFNRAFDGYEGDLMSLMELRISEVYKLPKYEKCLLACRDGKGAAAYDPRTTEVYPFNTADHHDAACIPSVRLTRKNGLPLKGEEIILAFLDNGLVPAALSPEDAAGFSDLIALRRSERGYVNISEDGHIIIDTDKLTEDISAGKFSGSINGMDFSMENLLSVSHIKADEEFMHIITEKLLNCEKVRADIDPYDEKLLSDPNRGHWELWDEGYSPCVIETSEPLIARNPVRDVRRDGVIAIDFGTKSTVVVFQKSSEHTLPMAIGTGRISEACTREHYENPTVMEFVNVREFLKKYRAKPGRPETLWEELPVSHTAYSDMKLSASRDYYAFFCDIKHWAGEGNIPLRICDRSGEEFLLPPYMSGEQAEFDPIELYAYYVGLYINNMRNGIYLDYYLSFPVTFEKAVRDRITESFRNGLMKSLPPEVLADDELMEDFRVDGTVSEPAAYAVCALDMYKAFPETGSSFHYGIFDFGGGTTDFDFGVCRNSEKKKYDYTIKNIGSGGDRYLGGENLLELLAVHVFRSNFDRIAENGITFTLPPRCREFAGAARAVARSREAEANMRHLMECLRPLWENTEEKREEFERGLICVDLFDKSGRLIPRFELNVSEEELIGIIRENIAAGIDNFFTSMSLAYKSSDEELPDNIGIMLAGNSCRSSLVTEIFLEKFGEGAEKLRPLSGGKDITFTLFPPLGTEDAYELMESRGIDPHRDSLEYPTGKTGVAFGLIMCRKGGTIERTSLGRPDEEIPFRYFIGSSRRGKFSALTSDSVPMSVTGRPDYNVWYFFTEADEDTFEIYYTSVSEAVTGNMPIDNVQKKKCRLNMTYENANIYIRATGPRTIQYAAATESGIGFENYLSRLVTVELE